MTHGGWGLGSRFYDSSRVWGRAGSLHPEDLIGKNGLGSSMTTADLRLMIFLGLAMAALSVAYTERKPGFVELTYILSSFLPALDGDHPALDPSPRLPRRLRQAILPSPPLSFASSSTFPCESRGNTRY